MCHNLIVMIILFSLCSCSQIAPHRTYQKEMEHEETSWLKPRENFPVVGGDRLVFMGHSRRAILDRTPSSHISKAEGLKEHLRIELRSLESRLNDDDKFFYERYQSHLGSISERIYFLRLSSRADQEAYLQSKGQLSSNVLSQTVETERGWDLASGMPKDQVMGLFGRPSSVEVAGFSKSRVERWTYRTTNGIKYIYFSNDKVEGWSERQ